MINLNENILTINEHQVELENINSISRMENVVIVNTKSAKLEVSFKSKKEAKQAINKIEELLLGNKSFIRCDSNTIFNLQNIKSFSVKKVKESNGEVNEDDYGVKANF